MGLFEFISCDACGNVLENSDHKLRSIGLALFSRVTMPEKTKYPLIRRYGKLKRGQTCPLCKQTVKRNVI
jgi:hypothetical protein